MATYKNLKSPNGDKLQVESAIRDGAGKNIENNYAKQNGFYSGMGVGKATVAQQIENISDTRGETQEAPFISQGTGTANNIAIVDVPPVAKLLEKQGYTVADNQAVKNPTFTDGSLTSWISTLTNNGVVNGYVKLTSSSGASYLSQNTAVIPTHKYLYIYDVYSVHGSGEELIYPTDNNGNLSAKTIPTTRGALTYFILTATSGQTLITERVYAWGSRYEIYVKSIVRYDLTQYFNGNDNIPADLLSHPDHWSWYYNGTGAYDAGSLQNASGRYLVCTGRQLWDGGKTNGYYLNSDGSTTQSETWSYTDYVFVEPNRNIYFSWITGTSAYTCFYDINKNFISSISSAQLNTSNKVATVPANAYYVRHSIATSRLAQLTISLYYSPEQGGEGYDQYYPYVEPKVYDTGTEELLAFDTKDPDGTWHRNTGNKNLGSLDWTKENNHFYSDIISDLKIPAASSIVANIVCTKYIKDSANGVYAETTDKVIGVTTTGRFYVYDSAYSEASALKTALNNVYCQYELADASKTTEQGASFPEDIQVNDYGMMYWLDTDNNLVSIPQGCKLFYPADYVLWTDTAYARTGGDATKIVLTEDISDTALAERGYIKTVDLSSDIFIDDTYLTVDYLYAFQQADVVRLKAKLTVVTVPAQGVEIMSIGEAINQGLSVVIVSSGTAKADIIEIDNGGEFDFTNTTNGDEVYIDGTVILG